MDNVTAEILSGDVLLGESFTEDEIKAWCSTSFNGYQEYAKVFTQADVMSFKYGYNNLNRLLGWDQVDKGKVKRVLSFGGGHGLELLPILEYSEEVYIVDSAQVFIRDQINGYNVKYVTADKTGKLDFEDNYFDVITCFGVLMYIYNAGDAFKELVRCLKPGGHLFIREPVSAVSSFSQPIQEVAAQGRGISVSIFQRFIRESKCIVIEETCLFFAPYIRLCNWLGLQVYNSDFLTKIDIQLCKFFKFNYKYYRAKLIDKFSYGSKFYNFTK